MLAIIRSKEMQKITCAVYQKHESHVMLSQQLIVNKQLQCGIDKPSDMGLIDTYDCIYNFASDDVARH
jgi:hypothetical protein